MKTNLPQRKQTRLKEYNYSQCGFYFVTVYTQNRACMFGDIVGADPCVRPMPKTVLNDAGKMTNKYWLKISAKFPNVKLDIYQIMPNHIHGIIIISIGPTRGSAPTIKPTTLGTIIQWFKTMTTNGMLTGRHMGLPQQDQSHQGLPQQNPPHGLVSINDYSNAIITNM